MIRFVLRRLPVALLVIFAGSLLGFLVPRLAPGDPAATMVGQNAPVETYQAVRAQMGLDLPIWQQYLQWMTNLAQGDLGRSYTLRQPVANLVADRLEATLELAAAALLITVVTGFALAGWGALSRRFWVRRTIDGATSLMLAIPAFLIGVLLIVALGIIWPIFPVSGTVTLSQDLWGGLTYLVLPAITVAFLPTAVFARLVQARMNEVKGEEFVRTAIAKGLSRRRINNRHIRRNSLAPALVVIGVIVSELLGGAIVVENIFARDGLGSLAVSSVFNRDYMVIQFLIFMSIAVATLMQLLTESLQAAFDPRIRHSG